MQTIALWMGGYGEILAILFLILLLFGSKKLPELSRALGKSLGEFRKGREDGNAKDDDKDKSDDEADK